MIKLRTKKNIEKYIKVDLGRKRGGGRGLTLNVTFSMFIVGVRVYPILKKCTQC